MPNQNFSMGHSLVHMANQIHEELKNGRPFQISYFALWMWPDMCLQVVSLGVYRRLLKIRPPPIFAESVICYVKVHPPNLNNM